MTRRPVVIALDQGSSSSRALALDSSGRVVARSQFPVRTFYPRAGWAEHDAMELARTQERALDAVLAKLPKSVEILGLGLACQRSTVVFWDRQTGRPACRAPSWRDGRAAAVTAALQDRQAQAHEITGLYLTPYYSAPKIRWHLDNAPEVRRLCDEGRLLAGPVSSFLIWRLTRGEVYAADPSMAQRMMLLNLRTLDWDETMLNLFSIPKAVLPSLLASSGPWGVIERGGRKIPLLACLGDQSAAVLGLGGAQPGASVANYGTGAFFLHNTGTVQHRIPGLLTSVGWRRGAEPPVFLAEGTVHAAGGAVDWLRDSLGLLKNGENLDRLCRTSKQRLLALMAIGGLGAPRWDYVTKTNFFGMTSRTTKADLVRAVMEGIAFLVSDIASAMRAAGLPLGAVHASGGLSRVEHLMRFQADILGLEVRRCREAEATALGAGSLAAAAAGADWAAALARVRTDKIFSPSMPEDEAGKLRSAWQAFVAAQARLSREISLP